MANHQWGFDTPQQALDDINIDNCYNKLSILYAKFINEYCYYTIFTLQNVWVGIPSPVTH